MKHKVIGSQHLLRLCRAAEKIKGAHVLSPVIQEMLDPDGKHVEVFHLLCDDGDFVRAFWLLKVKGLASPVSGSLDISIAEWNRLVSV